MEASLENRALVRTGTTLQLRRNRFHPSAGTTHRMLRVGVCGTDLQIQRGARGDRARILGHEGIGLRLPDTDRETIPVCEIFDPVDRHDQDTILGHSYDGLLRDYFTSSSGHPYQVVVAQDLLPLDLAPLTEPLATALYGWELIGEHLRPPGRVAIFGAGSAALLLALTGERLGYRIELIQPRPERAQFLTGRSILGTAELRTHAAADSADGAIVCLPREAAHPALDSALTCLRPGGVLNLFGGIPAAFDHPDLPGVDLAAIRRRNVCGHTRGSASELVSTATGKPVWVTGHRGSSPQQLDAAQRLLIDDPARYGALVTHVISLEEAATRIPALAARDRARGEHIKVVIDPTMTEPTRPADIHTSVAQHLRQLR
ncbi:dehydrogenase [Nocardia aurea]|uniref:dehydrogenase n=1 Tax=Nocardia aurea TaxID=2144174 RepID=UPI001300708A|nr:dehydrogenase [Nocardia aurea]